MTAQGESKVKIMRGLLFVAAMFGVATSAVGGAGVITTVVSPLSTEVTYGTNALSPTRPALVTFVGYTVEVANAGGNTVNNVRLTATVSATDSEEKLTFSSVEGASCTPGADLTSIECVIGQLRAGQSAPKFAVFFQSPVKKENGVADGVGQDRVTFSGTTYYAEGTGGSTSPPQNSTTTWTAAEVTLGTTNLTLVKSALPKSGGLFFTGDNAATTFTDRFGVSVKVPSTTIYTTAELRESDITSDINCSSYNNFLKCYQAAITIPGLAFSSSSGDYLTIVARVDASNIKAGTKISDVRIQYEYVDNFNVPHLENVGFCASPTTPRGDGIPCIAKAVYYKNKGVQGWTSELGGDFEWTFLNLKNGLIKVF